MNRELALRICNRLKARQDAEVFTVVAGQNAGAAALFEGDAAVCTHPEILGLFQRARAQAPRHGESVTVAGETIFYDRVVAAPVLCLCGGGHVSLPVAQLARKLGFAVMVIDEREQFANSERFPMADQIICADFESGLKQVEGGPNHYFVIVTRGHQYDRFCLESILRKQYAYVGMIGSRGKVGKVFESLLEQDYTREQIASVHSPIGLPIGANTPDELAVSILAEIISVRNAKGGDSGWDEALVAGLLEHGAHGAMCTVVSKHGSAPRSPGARMFVTAEGRAYGTVGGGAGEKAATDRALEVIATGVPGMYHCRMEGKSAADEGMICGGVIDVFIQRLD